MTCRLLSRFPFRHARSLLAVLAFATGVVAQVPPGWCVVSAVKQNGSPFPGNGGIYLTHPRTPMAMLEVTGLPPALTAANTPFPLPIPNVLGANCVLLQDSGDLLVAPVVQPGQSLDLHRITVTGNPATGFAASAITTINLGFGNPMALGGGVSQMAFVTANTVLVGGAEVSDAAGGPGPMGVPGPVQLGLVDLMTGSVTPLLLGPVPYPAPVPINLPAQINALTYDATTGWVTFGVWAATSPPLTPRTSWLCRFPLATPTNMTLVTWMPGTIHNLATRPVAGGSETIAALEAGTLRPVIYRLPAGGVPTVLLPNAVVPRWDRVSALTVEPSTGELLLSGIRLLGNATTGGVHWLQMATGRVTQLGNTLASGIPRGSLSGIAVGPALVRSGRPSSCPLSLQAYAWSDVPHPDKLPFVGNTKFFVDVAHAPATTPTFEFAILSFAPSPPMPVLCPNLLALVTLSPSLSIQPSPPAPTQPPNSSRFCLPLPAGLTSGFPVYLQSAHFTGSGIFASDLLEVSIL